MKETVLLRYILLTCLSIFQWRELHAQKNYIYYHKQVIEAEKLFLNHDFIGSIDKYKTIFTIFSKPFAKDCFIALEIAAIRSDTTNAKFFFQKCFATGVNWIVIKSVPQLRQMLDEYPHYESEIKQLYNNTRPNYVRSLDTTLLGKVIVLVKKDSHSKTKEIKNLGEWQKQYTEVLDDNLDSLVTLVKAHGYPGEHRIGIWDHEIDNVSGDLTYLLSSIPSVLFFHHECGFPLLKDELMLAVVNGELQPREYALIYEWSVKAMRDRAFVQHYNGKYSKYLKGYNIFNYRHKCTDDSLAKSYNIYLNNKYYSKDIAFVNSCRSEIGMADIEHDNRKKKFEKEFQVKLFFGLFKTY